MALGGAIAWFRVAEFPFLCVWTAVLADINEIKTDDPQAGPRIIAAYWAKRLLTRISNSVGGTV